MPVPVPPGLELLSQEEEALVRALLPAIRELIRRMDEELLERHDISQAEYAVLMHLSEDEDWRLSLSGLARMCHQSLSTISRTVGRLEKTGDVERMKSATDGRGSDAVLTKKGLARLEEAWPTHLRSTRVNFLDHLSDIDTQALATALRNIAGQ